MPTGMAPVVRKAKRTSTTARGKPAPTPIDLDTAFQRRLERGGEPYTAIEELNTAIVKQRILLFVEGREKSVDPHWFKHHACVKIELVGGRSTAVVVPFDRGFAGGPYKWTVSGDGMESDASQSASRHRRPPGRRP